MTSTGNTTITFTRDECLIHSTLPTTHQTMTFRVSKEGNLFSLGIGITTLIENNIATTKVELDTIKWHLRLGHLNSRYLNKMQSQKLILGLPALQATIPLCVACTFGKQHKQPYPTKSHTRATQVLALVHTDLCGPMQTPSISKALYFLIFLDNFSRYTHIYFLQKKSDTLLYFKQYKNFVENETGMKIIYL